MAGVFGNPMQLTWPLAKYVQPGAPEFGTYDIGGDSMQCMVDGTIARRIGSTTFDWICPNGHQFHNSGGVSTYLSATPILVLATIGTNEFYVQLPTQTLPILPLVNNGRT